MDYSKITLFQMMNKKMGYLAERQDVLSKNIANVDTPGYEAQDLKELDFKKIVQAEARRLKIRATSLMHTSGTRKMPDDYRGIDEKPAYERTPVKNNVVIEEQMAKVAEVKMQHQMATNLYTKTAAMFKTAIGNR